MALPYLQTLEDCADFHKTVEPFLPQLYELPQRLLESFSNRDKLLELYVDTNPFISAVAISILLGFVFLVVSEANQNFSEVDRCWSLLPTFYIAHYAVWARLAGLPSQRNDAVLVFAVTWSARLTFNYWRRGGYEIGSEDYRWKIIRDNVHPFLFHLLNFTFISFIQSVLLMLLAAPAYVFLLASRLESHVTAADGAYVLVELSLILIEWISDQQQWDFHNAKSQYQKSAKVPVGYKQVELDRGFNTTGLWAFSRHPNFFAEQLIWFCFYQWSCFATMTVYSWAFTGSACLLLVFQGSTWLTELISSRKYPDYQDYQRQVGRFMPTSLRAYEQSTPTPKIIRTSDLAKKQKQK